LSEICAVGTGAFKIVADMCCRHNLFVDNVGIYRNMPRSGYPSHWWRTYGTPITFSALPSTNM
jgi:hypothetical protein